MSLTVGQIGILNAIRDAGMAVTRAAYIEAAYGDGVPDPWTPEDEAELPEFLQEGHEGESPPAGS